MASSAAATSRGAPSCLSKKNSDFSVKMQERQIGYHKKVSTLKSANSATSATAKKIRSPNFLSPSLILQKEELHKK